MTAMDDELKQSHFRVAIFGSARIIKDSLEYTEVFNLARMIAEAGMDLITGGGPGLMDGASEGYHAGKKNASQHSIGLNIRLPREQEETAHLDIKKNFERFSQRLDHFILLSNAVVVAPGGIGTLLELFYTWQLMQVKHICTMPIVLMGDRWTGLIEWLRSKLLGTGLIDSVDLSLLISAGDCQEAFKVIHNCYELYRAGKDENFCLNYQKYGLGGSSVS